ncbi:prolyl 3-hydroxylase 2-like [Hypanus sabinus]|uniref:prolyl 3-hydroxylase 2-like n=1 Tax=Hypanus sabinus TaxID=79690 RepID=UPI0028C49022|nr:prolyl 3-hydroxylase 2-like [Hypanus sabinus]
MGGMSSLLGLALYLGCGAADGPLLEPFDLLYEEGIRAYYRSDWPEVVRAMEAAVDSYRQLRRLQVRCRLECAARHGLGQSGDQLVATVLHRADCIRRCQTGYMGPASIYRVSPDIEHEFERRGPYNYLQLAYYKGKIPATRQPCLPYTQMLWIHVNATSHTISSSHQLGELDKAAAAAHTFFLANPEHMEMRQSLERYRQMEGVQESHFADREIRPYMEAFNRGLEHFGEEEYGLAIAALEEALSQFWQAEKECRAYCQGPLVFDSRTQQWRGLHLYEIITAHYLQVLVCEHGCVRELSTRAGRLSPIDSYLPLHYHCLQYSYYKVKDYKKSLEAARSYLLLVPEDVDMLASVASYRHLLQAERDPASVKPRQELVQYMERYRVEKKLLQSLTVEWEFTYMDPMSWSVSQEKNEDKHHADRSPATKVHTLKKPPAPVLQKKRTGRKADRNLREGTRLEPTHRASVQRMLLVVGSLAPDGHLFRKNAEMYSDVFQYGFEGRISMRGAKLFYDVSERVRQIVHSYFMLNSTLYFSFTHLVCRTAIEGQQDNRNDLSHPIHADNCLLDPDAQECWKEPPAYTHRDYSAILYLNGDFEGGEFIFTEADAKTITAAVKPRCGRVLSFSSGGENPHGVMAVTRGQRCAVALWFTLNPHFRELERIRADEVVQLISLQQSLDNKLHINPRDEL